MYIYVYRARYTYLIFMCTVLALCDVRPVLDGQLSQRSSDLNDFVKGESGRSFLTLPGLLSNQGENCINVYFILVPLGKEY